MQTPSGATSDTSVTDLLEDHFDSLRDFAASPRNNESESDLPAALPSPALSEHSAKENAPNNERTRKVVKNNILYEADPSSGSITQQELDSAKAEAAAWRASQEALVNRVHLLESRILEEAARADAGYSAAEAAQHSLAAGFGDFKQQSSLMAEECARREAELVAHFTALSQAKDEEHSVAILNSQEQLQIAVEEKNKLLETVEDDHREALELRGRVENSGKLRDAVRELTRQKKALESQLYTAKSTLEKERQKSKDFSERLIAAEASAMQATQQAKAACRQWDTSVQEAQHAKQRETQLSNELKTLQGEGTANADAVRNTAKEQLAILSELAQKRGAALCQIVNLLAGTANSDGRDENGKESTEVAENEDKAVDSENMSRPSTDDSTENVDKINKQKLVSSSSSTAALVVDPDYAVQLVISVCQGLVDAETEWEKEREELHGALEEAMEGTEDLIRRLRKVESRKNELESQEADARAVLGAVEKIQNRASMAENALNACREELENAASKAAASVMEAAQLKAVAAAAEEALKLAEARAVHAEKEAAVLRQGSGAKEQRADEMRAAAAAAMDVAQSLQSSIQHACATAAAEMQHAAMELHPSAAAEETNDYSNMKQQVEIGSNADRILSAVFKCIERLQEAVALDTTTTSSGSSASSSGKNLASAVEMALLEASSGFSIVAALVQEYMRVHAALLRAVGRTATPGDQTERAAVVVAAAPAGGQQQASLEALLSDLLDRFSGLTAAVQTEKSSLEEQLSSLRAEHAELLIHAESLESVLRSAVHARPGPDMDSTGEALLQLVAARRRIAELEAECAHLNESAQQAQHAAEESKASASRDWAEVRADVAQLVQHAERAQIDAESALQQQRAETARLVSEARAREHSAAAARSQAEAQTSQLREEAAGLSRELQAALITATTWETRANLAEDALQVARTQLQNAKQEQAEQQQLNTVTAAAATSTFEVPTNLPGLQPSVQLSSDDIDTLRRRVIQLESALAEFEQHAATSARDLIEARAKAEIAEEAAAAHHAASEAAMRQVDIATQRATEAETKYAALELDYLEQQTAVPHHRQFSTQQQAPTATVTASPSPLPVVRNGDDDTMLKITLSMPPPSADISTLRRRLEAALRQIEGLKSLNVNLRQQLIANASSLSRNTILNTGNVPAGDMLVHNSNRTLADETAHAMIDALQLQMEAMGLMTGKQQRGEEESRKMQNNNTAVVPGSSSSAVDGNNSSSGPIQRVVALWKQACASRDEKLEEAARRLQSAGIELGAKEAELAAMRQAAIALKKARNEAITAATELEHRMREARACKRLLEAQLAAAKTGLGDRDLLRERITLLEMQYNALERKATASEMRAVNAEKALAGARATVVATSDQLRRFEEAESRARAANERASEAEKALARHLESHSQQDRTTSLGKQLEAAWATERQLAQRLEEMQIEAAGARSELKTAVKDVEMYAERASALQEQLNEAVGALAEQGAALEAVQCALQNEKEKARQTGRA